MSNILKSLFIQQEEDGRRVIDSNVMLDERMQQVEKEYQRFRQSSLQSESEEADNEQQDEEDSSYEERSEPQEDYVALAKEEAEQILVAARQQAEEMLAKAQTEAEALRSHAREEGQRQGYDVGVQQAALEAAQQAQQWEQEKGQWIEEYRVRQDSMERELVDVICQVFEHVFSVQFADKKELVLHLLDNALSNIEGSKEFLIRVCETNYEYLKNKKDVLQEKVGSDAVLDIIMDPIMDSSQCLIETDGGVFDCSLGVEMANLVKDIKSLNM